VEVRVFSTAPDWRSRLNSTYACDIFPVIRVGCNLGTGIPAAMASNFWGGTLHLPGGRAALSEPVARSTLKSAPAIRNIYSCRFPEAALPPEFSKRRPVIVVSWKNSLTGPVLVVPITTQPQSANPWAVIAEKPKPRGELRCLGGVQSSLHGILHAAHRDAWDRATADGGGVSTGP
jgi:hypothetical protein